MAQTYKIRIYCVYGISAFPYKKGRRGLGRARGYTSVYIVDVGLGLGLGLGLGGIFFVGTYFISRPAVDVGGVFFLLGEFYIATSCRCEGYLL